MNLNEQYGLRRVINACGKMTALGGAAVLPEIAPIVSESLGNFYELDALQAAAGRIIAEATGAEFGCVTACTSAGISTCVAACMTGNHLGKVLQLPDPTGMPHRVLIQKGHCVNYGAPVTQAIRLAGAEVIEVGTINRCPPESMELELNRDHVAAVVAVESHHTVQHGWIPLSELVPMAHAAGVPVIVDGAAQDLRFQELIGYGSDLVIASAHKFLCSTTAGVVAGRRELVEAVYLQNRGIGRGMKAGKEAIFGAMAALEYRMQQDVGAWTAEQDRRVALIISLLQDIPGLSLGIDPDPNGCPFSRARLAPDEQVTGHTARSLTTALAEGDPTVVARAHHAEEGYIYLDAVEMPDKDIQYACQKVRTILGGATA
ncbi:MAG: aminotransferase class V-fold PLP-dependent enzyme [Planctomycetaceae bacterium]|nr:aminotransferase class V-fold PLP-dependent enzyme [Planctomycetaceae bacterium]